MKGLECRDMRVFSGVGAAEFNENLSAKVREGWIPIPETLDVSINSKTHVVRTMVVFMPLDEAL